jgi:single-strand DNA-binding protein
MANLNKVMLIGNLTRDPQMKTLPSNTAIADFGLAVSRRFKTAAGEDREETCFLDCTAFGKQAQVIGEYCKKGKSLFVEGRLKFDSWDDKQGFGRRSKVSVVVENFQFLGARDSAALPGAAAHDSEKKTESREQRPSRRKPPFEEETMFQEADIPF